MPKGSERTVNKLKFIKEKVCNIFSKAPSAFCSCKAFCNKYSKIIFCIVAVVAVVFTTLCSGIVVGYSVEYNGKSIAIVRNKADYDAAIDIAQSMVKCDEIKKYAYTPDFSITLTVEGNITETATLAQNIINETESINLADALFINGEFIACASAESDLEQMLNDRLDSYNSSFENATSVFVDDVEVVTGYYLCENILNDEAVIEKISALQVKTVVSQVEQTVIPFKSITRKTDTRYVGEAVTAVVGQQGIEEKVANIVYINGEEVSRELLESVVVKSPVDEVVVIGTKKRPTSSSDSSFKVIWPLQRVAGQVISSYWGDGRNHQALDIASPSGTPIYAAQGGTVVTATYISSYGNYIIIDHGNGYQTCYAHASKLYVTVGESVAQGEVIAAVGSTGNSTGPHLHFEIRKNGVKLDPAGFLGLY